MLRYLLPMTGVAVAALLSASPASALTMKECSVKFQAAKDAGTLGDTKWNDFRKKECAADDEAAAPAKPAKKSTKKEAAANDDGASGLTSKECSAKYQAAKDADALNGMKWNDFRKAECGPGASATVTPAKAPSKKAAAANDDEAKGLTSKECSAKYQAAKDADALNGMKWNDFRKAECGPGATTTFAAPKQAAKKSAATDDDAKGLSMKECSAKYQAAKDAGTLGGLNWNDFRKTQCSADAAAAPAPAKQAASADGKGLSMKECSARYQNAKASGSLGSLKWNDFRKAQCGAGADDDETVPQMDEATYDREPETPVAVAPRGVSFPRGVSRKFASETPAKQRMHTCLEQYYENKDAGTLNGLRWIQKGGGYYSLCNQRLKVGS